MTRETGVANSLARTGAITGIIASLIYPAWSFLPLPDIMNLLFHFAFGPLIIVSFMGLNRLVKANRDSTPLQIATIFGIIAGCMFTLMTIVQSSNLSYIYNYIRQAQDETTKEIFRRILQGVFTVQLGIDVSWDIFITLATILFGLSMFNHPRFGKVFGWVGILVGGVTLFLNLYTFPVPPREAGLMDLGPAVGLWFLAVSIQMIRSLTWMGRISEA